MKKAIFVLLFLLSTCHSLLATYYFDTNGGFDWTETGYCYWHNQIYAIVGPSFSDQSNMTGAAYGTFPVSFPLTDISSVNGSVYGSMIASLVSNASSISVGSMAGEVAVALAAFSDLVEMQGREGFLIEVLLSMGTASNFYGVGNVWRAALDAIILNVLPENRVLGVKP